MNNPSKLDLKELNPEQTKAVLAGCGPVLVIAGAGSGKTKVLVNRAAYLIAERAISPYHILAVTFTNKAAKEMKERLASLTGLEMGRMWIGTFHSICARILRIEKDALAVDGNFVIYDTSDSRNLMKKCVKYLGLDSQKYAPAGVLASISQAKNKLEAPEDYAKRADSDWENNISSLYREYQKRLRQNNALDFDDLLTETVWLFKDNQRVLAKYRERFKHILVDEYQDTNPCQYELIRLLGSGHGNIFVVGDPDQSIYGWRGADIKNILDFKDDYPNCTVVKLVRNYRSTQNILDASNRLIANNQGRFEKDLITENGAGEKISYHVSGNDKEESRYILKTLVDLRSEGYELKDMAILYRTHAQSRAFEDDCIRFNIPYRIFGGMRFYERKEIKDSLAYLRLTANPADGESLTRIYNEPKRGIGKTTWDKLVREAEKRDQCLYDILAVSDEIGSLNGPTQKKLLALYRMIDEWQDFVLHNSSIAQLLAKIWEDSGYLAALQDETDGEERRENLEQLFNLAAEFDGYVEEMIDEDDGPLTAFLNQISLATDMDEEAKQNNYLSLMTLHAAKGLEFPIICLVGMEEGVFPHSRVKSSFTLSEMEEERRLCYVGITRAKERLIMTGAEKRLTWGNYNYNMPSRFMKELPQELLELSGNTSKDRLSITESQSINIFTKKNPEQPEKPQAAAALIKVGDRVIHAKFGEGIIVSASAHNDDMKVSVAFPEKGIKEFLWSYAPMKKL